VTSGLSPLFPQQRWSERVAAWLDTRKTKDASPFHGSNPGSLCEASPADPPLMGVVKAVLNQLGPH